MSELDADLYGDLYGNDEADFPETNEEKDAQPVAEPTTTDPRTAPASKPAETSTSKPPTAPPLETSVPASQSPTQISAPTPIAPTFVPQTQQIPTYEQPQPSEYRDMSASRSDGMYQNIPVNERTVRPSEMKDEGLPMLIAALFLTCIIISSTGILKPLNCVPYPIGISSKMFIGGLNWDTTDDALRDYFTQFGKVDACTIMRDAAGRSRCFAFLTFEDPASVNAVMVREHFLDGKIIDPKRAIPRQEHQRATKLFIGGLAGSVTSESMREFFSQFGKVIDSTVMLDRETGRSKGFGFVSFEDTNVQPFLGFGNLEIDGKLIDVKLAQPRYQRDNYPNEDGAAGGDFVQGGTGGARFGGQQGNFAATVPGAAAPAAGNTPFDPQALAALYTRMFQMAGGGQVNPAMMGGMGGMGGGMGMPGGMRPGMGMGMGNNMGANMGMGMGGGAAGGMGGMGRGNPAMMGAGGAMNPNIPRGPRGAPGAPAGPAGMSGHGVGPQRSQRGQHNFHPYAR
ncbi:hypothetical protein BD779DRAFT_1475837 [Infundibulicybe gibba]|nr:hypothetical protein BD779DRAFT_1475837 [Infundibulicybe gibba]